MKAMGGTFLILLISGFIYIALSAKQTKDTFIALDMIFIGPGGKIVNIVHETVPGSLSFIESAGPVLGVLEVRAKTAARLGIKKGDRVKHRIFE